MAAAPTAVSAATRQIFHAMCTDGTGKVSSAFLQGFLARNGLLATDPRLKDMYAALGTHGAVDADVGLSVEQFSECVSSCASLVHKAATGTLRVPNFEQISAKVAEVYEKVLPNKGGMNAQYIKQLAQVDPEQFAISVTTVDGQHFSVGDADNEFCIQSCSKPISYLIAQSIYGSKYVHEHVGTEPSGRAFNEMCLKDKPDEKRPGRKIPHNPCINAGAIMAVSMVHPELSRKERHEKVLDAWRRLSGPDAPIGYDEDTYVSESADASRNWCLGYMMMHDEAFPETLKTPDDLKETLELYFQICSTLSTNRAMANMAATMANGGLNPLSGERVFEADQVRNALPIMMMAGMYDYSGQWAFDIGVPAKSGVGGCVFIVVPNVCGISLWSPRLDEVGNSTRGVHGATELGAIFQLNSFDVFQGLTVTKIDPRKRKNDDAQKALASLLFAAAEGDVAALSAAAQSGSALEAADYDSRTALHLAAAEGHAEAVKFLVTEGGLSTTQINAEDRWGGTATDDAVHHGHEAVAAILKEKGGVEKKPARHADAGTVAVDIEVSNEAPMVLFAAAEGDVDQLVKFKAAGVDLRMADYDRRTALHLAASNGMADAVKYLLAQAGADAKDVAAVTDRWGATPLADTVREGHDACKALLEAV